jgi:DNA-binding NarL/FixJ family response regulator
MHTPREKLEVLLVDDHDLFREGLKLVLGQLKCELRFHEAANLAALHAMRWDTPIDLVLLDYHLPDCRGFEGLALVRQMFESAMIVVISGENNPRTIQQTITHGASGFIPKASSGQVLMAALQLVLAGGIYLPAEALSEYLVSSSAANAKQERSGQLLHMLSGRQREVLMLALHGKTNKLIARELGISDHTVKAHLSIAFKALGVSNRCEAVYAAARYGLELPPGAPTVEDPEADAPIEPVPEPPPDTP